MTTDSDPLIVTDLRYSAAPRRQQRSGMLGFLTVDLDDRFRLAGVMLRRTRRGILTLSFPRGGRPAGDEEAFVFRPLDNEARVAFEHDVFSWLPEGVEGDR